MNKRLTKEYYTAWEVSRLSGLSKQLITYYMKQNKISCKVINGIRYTNKKDVEMLANGIKPPAKQGGYVVRPSKINLYNDYIGVIASNTKNEFLFDADMFQKLSQYRWNENGAGYLNSTIANKTISAHHLVIGKPKKGFVIDHIDLNRKNCRISNLRIITIPQNGANAKLSSRNKSGFKGVCWDAAKGKWKATIGCIHIGRYNNKVDAAKAYDEKLINLYGDCALTNAKLGLFDKQH